MHISKQHGFTLIELVMVIVIIGILAAMAVPRMSLTGSSVHAQAAQIARDLRHVQMLAMAQGRTLTFVSLGGAYRCTDSTSTVITDPATQQAFNLMLEDGITLSNGNISFDSLGRPVSAATPLAGAVSYNVSGEDQSSVLNVTPITGFVTVTP